MYIGSVILNTLLFGYMAFTDEKMGVSHRVPNFLKSTLLITTIPILYIVSFFLILISPGGLLRNIITMIGMQLLMNHLIWGTLTGIIGGLESKNRMKQFNKEHGLK